MKEQADELWKVHKGEQASRLKLRLKLPEDSTDKLFSETEQILSLCGSPALESTANTGLVLGMVQSGKTMSFTSLIALARDNDYQVVIVIAGTSKVLVAQSTERLAKDLQLDGVNEREWTLTTNPSIANGKGDILSTLKRWKSEQIPKSKKRTALVTVMKNPTHLGNLIEVVESLKADFQGVPVLIVDDEADQASMDTEAASNRGRVSAGQLKKHSRIYSLLLKLKAALPHHTFVQYTATPQAPLFIRREDELSPNFVKLLIPGDSYVGGRSFFASANSGQLLKHIPPREVHSDSKPLESAPPTLLDAMRVFYLGVAAHYVNDESGNRSMMVHPSQFKNDHSEYDIWVRQASATWLKLLKKPDTNPDKVELVSEFEKSYKDLLTTAPSLAPFKELMSYMELAIESTLIKTLNSNPTSATQINWKNNDYHILIGGQVMDRGFTVEGLTVTYMPRGKGGGNADTLQQRARFFGYKRSYLGLCRVYLLKSVRTAFEDYVQHELDMRQRLTSFDASGRHLNEFERKVMLPSSISNLTRKNVLSADVEGYKFGGNWITTKTVTGSSLELERNKATVKRIADLLQESWAPDTGNAKRTPEQIHLRAEAKMADLLPLLSSFDFLSDTDSKAFDMLASYITEYIGKHPSDQGLIYQMSSGKTRSRSVSKEGKVGELFQGKNPETGRGAVIYPGDAQIKDSNRFVIQIHRLKAVLENTKTVLAPETYALAVWVPSILGVRLVKLADE